MRTNRDILESAAKAVADQATKVGAVVTEAIDAGLDGSDPITVAVKMVRVELFRRPRDRRVAQVPGAPSVRE